MTTDESIMAEMLDRATNPTKERVDELGVQMFCIVVRSNSQLIHKAQSMIVAKVHSSNVTEATRAISLLEECMSQCGEVFQEEASKFRFLNELIRLVSKKYDGAETALVVKQRIMECLLLWTTEFPQRQKIRDTYEMLRRENDIDHNQTAAAIANRESVLSTIDEALFAKLIKSQNPENFKRANLLVQYRMAQEARRNDLLAQHRLVISEVQEIVKLLNQMLDNYDPTDYDMKETLHQLYKSCKKHKPIFQHLPELLGESDAQLIENTLETNTALLAILDRYNQIVSSPTSNIPSTATVAATTTAVPTTIATLSATAAATPTAAGSTGASNGALINELLGDFLLGGSEPSSTTTNSTNSTKANALDDLSDIFNVVLAESESKQQEDLKIFPQVGSGELLAPLVPTQAKVEGNGTDSESQSNGIGAINDSKQSSTLREMPEIDKLSEKLFEEILPDQKRMSSFKREPEKLTINDLAHKRIQVKPVGQSTAETLDDVPLLNAAPAKLSLQPTPTVEVAVGDALTQKVREKQIVEPPTVAPKQFRYLSDISIDLDNIQASGEERVMLDNDDMLLCLNMTDERPSSQVSVIVVSAQNKNRLPVKDFHFEASVKKPCKVRLLPPTSDEMNGYKPFRPPTPINQVMLLLNPTGKPVDVICIVSYRLGDDPDSIKESIVAQGITYVD